MLTGITLENFKAFKEPQFIPIKPITLVFGPNNAGKSSIIHALAFLKHVHDTNGDCNPGGMSYGWSNLDLGSWKNLVFGQNENTSMMIKLHTETATIQWRFENTPHGPKVVSFEIEEKFGEGWSATAKGENVGTKGIIWQVKMHSSHSLWQQYKEALWNRMTGLVSLRYIEDKYGVHHPDLITNETSENKWTTLHKEEFEKHFDLWLDGTWKEPPLDCEPAFKETYALPFTGIFPQQKSRISKLASDKYRAKTRRSPLYLHGSGRSTSYNKPFKSLIDEVLHYLENGISNNSLTCVNRQELFDLLLENGAINTLDDLHVDEIATAFLSHLHLDAQRFPPEGALIKQRLASYKVEHQPWLRLIDEEFEHYYFRNFREYLDLLHQELFSKSDETFSEIKSAHENRMFAEKWPILKEKLIDEGANNYDGVIEDIYKYGVSSIDLPPLWAVNDGLRQIGIPYGMAVRKHVAMVYPPNTDPRNSTGDPDDTKSDYELVFIGKSGVHSIHNLGSGVRVIVPVIVALASAEVGLLSIEEPECHVHPKLQAELGDLLIQRAVWTYYEDPLDDPEYPDFFHFEKTGRSNKENRRNSFTLVETHSEHLILRILRRIRETTHGKLPEGMNPITKDDVAVLFVSPSAEGSTVRELRITDKGKFLDSWPGGFFEESFDEMF
jgi:hypothetical protein